jgi:hypothetical protein
LAVSRPIMLMLIVGGSFVAGSDNPHDGIDAAGGRPPHLSDWGTQVF